MKLEQRCLSNKSVVCQTTGKFISFQIPVGCYYKLLYIIITYQYYVEAELMDIHGDEPSCHPGQLSSYTIHTHAHTLYTLGDSTYLCKLKKSATSQQCKVLHITVVLMKQSALAPADQHVRV